MEKKIDYVGIEKKVNKIIANTLTDINADEVKADAKFIEDMDADSIDILEICLEIEKEYGFYVDDVEFENMKKETPQDFYDLVYARLSCIEP